MKKEVIKKIKIVGHGGHGVKFLAANLAKIVSGLGFNVSVIYDYDAAVKGGSIQADLVYSSKSINNPLIAEPDVYLSFIEITNPAKAGQLIDLADISWREKLSRLKPLVTAYINMVALGYLLKIINVNLKSADLNKLGLSGDNILAIRAGYDLN